MADVGQVNTPCSLPSRMREAEHHWVWKVSLRAIICIINIIAIGCAAWVFANAVSVGADPYIGYFEFERSSISALLVLCISLVWCACCILIPFVLKPPRAIHSGAAVGTDLVLWLGFIIVGLLSVASVINIIQFGSDPAYLEDPTYSSSYQGNYYLAPNNTWLYNVTHATEGGSDYYNYTLGKYVYPSGDINNVTRDCTPQFTSCAQQDADINRIWHEKSRREGVEIVVTAVLWLDVLLHFTLFVWACVDTHRLRSKKRGTKEQIVTDKVMADLERRGLLTMYNQDYEMQVGVSQPQLAHIHDPAVHTTTPETHMAEQ